MVIGIAGPTASGKTTVANNLEELYGAVRVRYSAILAEIARDRGLDPSDKATLQKLYLEGRKTEGEDFLARKVIKQLVPITNDLIVIEGNRRLVDVDALRSIAAARDDELKLIFIDASVETRYNRYCDRLRELGDEPVMFKEFCTLEKNEAEAEISDLRSIFEKEGMIIDTDHLNTADTMKKVEAYLGLPR